MRKVYLFLNGVIGLRAKRDMRERRERFVATNSKPSVFLLFVQRGTILGVLFGVCFCSDVSASVLTFFGQFEVCDPTVVSHERVATLAVARFALILVPRGAS